jgi:hypothetical protein
VYVLFEESVTDACGPPFQLPYKAPQVGAVKKSGFTFEFNHKYNRF